MTHQAQIREALKMAHQFVKLGLTFVPVPTTTTDDHNKMVEEAQRRLDIMVAGERKCAACCHRTGGGYCDIHDSYRDTPCGHYK